MDFGSSKLRGLRIALYSSNKYAFLPGSPYGHRRWYVTRPAFLIPRYALTITFFQVSWDLPSLASLRLAILTKLHLS